MIVVKAVEVIKVMEEVNSSPVEPVMKSSTIPKETEKF
jgi:hypothetical protein